MMAPNVCSEQVETFEERCGAMARGKTVSALETLPTIVDIRRLLSMVVFHRTAVPSIDVGW